MILTNKKGSAQVIFIIIFSVLGLAVLFMFSGILRVNFTGFQETITPCSNYNGICREGPQGCYPEEQWLPQGDRDCKKKYDKHAQCCGSEAITESLNSNRVAPRSDEITIQVVGKSEEYRSQEEIPAMVGEPVTLDFEFKTTGDSESFICNFIFSNDNDDILQVVERSGRLYFERKSYDPTSDVAQTNEDLWKPCSDLQNKASIFTMDNYHDGVNLKIKKSYGVVMEYQEMVATFPIRLEKPEEEGMMLEVSDKYRDFSQGETIKLFTGRPYTFKAKIIQEYLKDYSACSIFIVDESSAEQVGASVRDSITNKQSTLFRSGENLAAAETNTGCGDDFTLNNVIFTQEHENKNLVLYTMVSDGVSPVAISKFNLDVDPPLTISGIGNDWTNDATITFECNVPECISISYRIPRTTDPLLQRNDCFTNVQDMKKLPVNDGTAVLELNKETMPALGFPGTINAPICLLVWYHPAQDVEDRHWAAFYTKNIKIDIEPPTISGINGLNIVCNDKEGSGCKNYYYDIIGGINSLDYNDYRSNGIIMPIVNNFISKGASWFIPSSLRCYDPGGDVVGSTISQGSYKTTGSELNTYDDGKKYVEGEACVYAMDNAGNQGKPSPYAFKDLIGAKEETLEEIRERLRQETGYNNPYYQIADNAIPQQGG